MDWMSVTVLTTTAGADMISELLMRVGSSGTMIEDKNDVAAEQRPEGQWDIIDEAIAQRIGDDVKVTGYFEGDASLADRLHLIRSELARLKDMDLGFDAGKLEMRTQGFEEEDWAQNWKKAFKPLRLGEHIVIKPGWCEFEAQAGDHIIEIDPGMAFGTGTHETTGMCVELIEKYVKDDMRVIDVGTGTGILAMAAMHMGASDALAIDIDRVAVRVAEENVRINGFEGKIRCVAGNLLDEVDEAADVVIANIIADVIIMIAEPVKKHIRPGGRFICSGIASERKQDVLDALDAAGYRVLDIKEKGGWCAMAAEVK